MTPTDHRPAELLDLDRSDMATMSCEEFARRADALRQIMRERWVAEANVHAMQEQERKAANERRAVWFVMRYALVWLACLALAFYLQSIGE